MNATKHGNKRHSNLNHALAGVFVVAGLILGAGKMSAQMLSGQSLAKTTDSIVQITAEAQGLTLTPSDQLPPFGTFWLVSPGGLNGCLAAPLPTPPFGLLPAYQVADGQFIVDGTGGEVASEQTLEAQAASVVNLINQIQGTQAVRSMRMATAMDSPGLPGFGDGGGGDYGDSVTNSYTPNNINTNLLWLQITNVFNGAAYANLFNATDQVPGQVSAYAIWSTPDLTIPFAYWQVETEVFPTNETTNCLPFAVATLGRQDLFLRAQDWTGVDSDGDGVPDWWDWLYFGVTTMDTSGQDYSGDGSTFAQDYSYNTPPTVFTFSGIAVANQYVQSGFPVVQLNVAGYPYSLGIAVDDTNFANDAVWQPYGGSNVTVNLGGTQGWHDVWIGLRGHADATSAAVWQWNRLKLDRTPPTLVITSPTNGVVTQPFIQLQGHSSEPLSLIRYDLSNAAGTVSNQVVRVCGQDYDTNTFEYTTTYFQAYGVSLTNGLNVVTLHAADYAGNSTTLTANFTLDYSSKTNPPVVRLLWPQNGLEICGSAIVCRGWVDDDTATVTAQLVDANDQTNSVGAMVGRDGGFYANSLTLASGANHLRYTVTDAAGNVATTNITVSTSDLELTIDPVKPGQALVTGTIGGTNYAIEVNGVSGTNNGDGTWAATITPIGIGGGAVVVNAVQNEGDPSAQQIVQAPSGTFMSEYHLHNKMDVYDWNFDNWNLETVQEDWDWSYLAGGTIRTLQYINYDGYYGYPGLYAILHNISIPAGGWPQPMPLGTMVTKGWKESSGPNPPDYVEITSIASPPQPEHTDTTQPMPYKMLRSTDDGKMSLATGGPVGSVQQNLWCLSGTATDLKTGLPIPAGQISIGGFGVQDTNAQLWVPLEDNGTVDITIHASGVQNFSYNVTPNKYTLVHQTRVAALTDANPARLNLGVGEYVDLGGLPDAIWSASGGGLATNGAVTFTAASNAPPGGATASVTGQSHGFTQTVNFNVLPPNGYDHAAIASTFTNLMPFPPATVGAREKVNVWIAPTSVSFYRVQFSEVGEDAVVKGYFGNTNLFTSNPPHRWHHYPDAGTNDYKWFSTDNLNYFFDTAGLDPNPAPPWSAGSLTYDIPVVWKISGNGQTNSMTGWNQSIFIDENGKVMVTKFGKLVTRDIFNVVNPSL